jgi:hypothetical protein
MPPSVADDFIGALVKYLRTALPEIKPKPTGNDHAIGSDSSSSRTYVEATISAGRPTHRPGSVGALPRLAAACAPKARPAAPCHVGVVGLEKGERRARKGRNTTACSDCSCSLPGTESRGASRQIRSSILFLLRCACAAVRNFWWSCLPGLICCLLPAACCPFRGNGMVATAGGRAAARRPTGRCICICMHACHTHTRS